MTVDPRGSSPEAVEALQATSRPTVAVHDDVPAAEATLVDAGLGAAIAAAAPLGLVQPMSCFARLAPGRVVGGAVGRTWGECCELQQLWVDPGHRRQGVGAALIDAFERHALARGCRTFYLETFSFQAPALYRSKGYRVGLQLRGFPLGICKFMMTKDAVDDAVPRR